MFDMTQQKQVKVSGPAYNTLKEMAKDPQYKGRGVTGVIDMLLFSTFTTVGSGRPFGSKKSNKDEKKG